MRKNVVVVVVVAVFGLGGLTGCATSSSSTDQGSLSDAPATNTTDTTSGGPCDGNPCIGDWQKEAAEGGTAVQCVDGTYSHAGGLSGACSHHGGEASGSTDTSTDSSTSTTPSDTTSGGPCDGNPCIGDWQKEAAEGGTVVQCVDGTYSHAGGLSGACSHHGGEASGSSDTSTNSSTDTTPTDSTPSAAPSAPAGTVTGTDTNGYNVGVGCSDDPADPTQGCNDAPTVPGSDSMGSCAGGITIDSTTTSCGFAEAVKAAYASDGQVTASDPGNGRDYTVNCMTSGHGTSGDIVCQGQGDSSALYLRWHP